MIYHDPRSSSRSTKVKIQIFQIELCRVSFNLIVHLVFKYIWYKVIRGHLQGHRVKASTFSDWARNIAIQLDFSLEFLNLMLGTLDIFWNVHWVTPIIGSNVRTKIHWIYLINLINYMSQPYVLESTLRISVKIML